MPQSHTTDQPIAPRVFCILSPALRPVLERNDVQHLHTASKVKRHLHIVLVAVFMYDFLQMNNNFVKYIIIQVFPWSVKPVRMSVDTFAEVLKSKVLYTPTPILVVYP